MNKDIKEATEEKKIEGSTGKIARKEADKEIEPQKKKTQPEEKKGYMTKFRERRERKGLVEPKYESWSNEVNEVALELANRWSYHILNKAVDTPSQAPEVYGYLKNQYRNYNFLIDNYVLEVASYFAQCKLESKIRIIKVVDNIDIENYKWARVELDGIHRFENYPNIPFTNVFMLSEEYFDDAIYWLNDMEWVLDNEDVRINLGRFSGSLIAIASWNIPIILVRDIPFSNKALFKAKVEAQKIAGARNEAQIRLINSYRTVVESYDAQIDQLNRDLNNYKKMHSDLQKKFTLEYRMMLERRKLQGLGAPTSKGSMYGLVIIIVVLGILSIVGFLT